MKTSDFIRGCVNVKNFEECEPRLMTVLWDTDSGPFYANDGDQGNEKKVPRNVTADEVVIRLGIVQLTSLSWQVALLMSDGTPFWLYENEVRDV
jgi:hypothetical protein